MSELWQLSALELAAKIRAGETSSREVVQAHLDRIDAVNAEVNAIVEIRPDDVLHHADAADKHQRDGGALGTFHGVPFTVKTNLDQVGYATTNGIVAMKDLIAEGNAPTVERMLQAGGVALGRTNMPDVGLRINTESELYGATHNPWRRGLTAGGSSGGEGAAIAAGMSPVGLGNDIGGSVRNPAFCNGVASLKPSRGRVPQGNPSEPFEPAINSQLMLQQGPLARTVADVRAAFLALAGAHPRDPEVVTAPFEVAPFRKRAALVPAPAGGSTHPDVVEGVLAAGRALEAEGYEVVEIAPPMLEDAYFNWAETMWTTLKVQKPLIDAVMGEGGRTFLNLTNEDIPDYTPEMTMAMHQSRHRISRAWHQFFYDFPVIVGPTWTQPPFAHGYDISSKEAAMSVVELFRFVLPANLMGLPAACVPTTVVNGLPMGAQIIADRFREDIALSAAEAIEQQCGVLTPIDPRP